MASQRSVVIVGGGVIGAAVASFLRRGHDGIDVAVLERDPSYRQASSALSASSIRQQFSTPLNIALSQASLALMQPWREQLGFVEAGYLYLATEAVDLRRGHDGLAALVREQWGDALFEGHLFVFLGRRLDRCKVLFFDRGGLVLYYKRLERGRFQMPSRSADGAAVEMDTTGLLMLLDGIDVGRVRRPEPWRPKKRAAA